MRASPPPTPFPLPSTPSLHSLPSTLHSHCRDAWLHGPRYPALPIGEDLLYVWAQFNDGQRIMYLQPPSGSTPWYVYIRHGCNTLSLKSTSLASFRRSHAPRWWRRATVPYAFLETNTADSPPLSACLNTSTDVSTGKLWLTPCNVSLSAASTTAREKDVERRYQRMSLPALSFLVELCATSPCARVRARRETCRWPHSRCRCHRHQHPSCRCGHSSALCPCTKHQSTLTSRHPHTKAPS